MKIALVTYNYSEYKGGVERYVFNLANKLIELKHDVHIFCHKFDCKKNDGLKFHKIPSIKICSPVKVLSFAFFTNKILKKLLKNKEFDIVHGFTRTYPQDIYRNGGGLHWDYIKNTYEGTKNPIVKLLMFINPRNLAIRFIENRIFKNDNCKKVICISKKCEEELVERFNIKKENSQVVYNGVDLKKFCPESREQFREKFRNDLGLRDSDLTVIFVGSGFKRKGLKFAIKSVSKVKDKIDIVLLVAGDDKHKRKYQRLANRLGVSDNVKFLGVVEDIQKYYAASDVMILPSLYDAFGNAVLEAMASQLPVIVYKTSGASEIVSDGSEGFVIEHPREIEKTAEKISILVDEKKRAEMGKKARRKSESFSIEKNCDEVLSIYEKIIDPNY